MQHGCKHTESKIQMIGQCWKSSLGNSLAEQDQSFQTYLRTINRSRRI